MIQTVGIIGAGAWGTALACVAARAGKNVLLRAREEEIVDSIMKNRENPLYLPDIRLPETIVATTDMKEVVTRSDMLLFVVPAQFLRPTAAEVRPFLKKGTPCVVCAKGFEEKTGALLGEIMAEELPDGVFAVLSGPTFAGEVAAGKPTALTLACRDEKTGWDIINALGSLSFRPYYSPDVISVQIGGAVKNVMAIAAGITVGKNLGDNAKSLLITRGLSEIVRLCVALGGQAETMTGLSGLGDLLLTANSMQSRNFSLGVALGRGKKLQDVLAERHCVTEGVHTAGAVVARARSVDVEMPICEALVRVLNENADIDAVLKELLSRPLREESFRSYEKN